MASQKTLVVYLVWVAVLVGEVFFWTWCRVECRQIGYRHAEAEARRQELRSRQTQLRIELGYLASPREISQQAEKKLGLTMPSQKQMVIINE
ncbi:MAG: hypothetical protein CSA22_03710 [Deltaproteobacteria bacterium]|nr:MAG: hypothetical protein CSA22_03710 [Deltaproteobacteria bacterium]